MVQKLMQLYPEAILAERPAATDGRLWLHVGQQYIGIPQENLQENEFRLLQSLFPAEDKGETFPVDPGTLEWKRFLLENGSMPEAKYSECRFLHYQMIHIQDDFLYEDWEEAVKSLFTGAIQLIPLSKHEGVIIEFQRRLALPEHELLSAIQMFESDFFFKIYFFIGHFTNAGPQLQELFRSEKDWFSKAVANLPGNRIFTKESVLPFLLLDGLPEKDKLMMFGDVCQHLLDDPELKKTVVTYIECQANATLAAKRLFMHRNSLQYRIEKFIEKTGIDIKQFPGALFVYMACLDFGDN